MYLYTLYAAAPLNAVVKSLVSKSGSSSVHKLWTLYIPQAIHLEPSFTTKDQCRKIGQKWVRTSGVTTHLSVKLTGMACCLTYINIWSSAVDSIFFCCWTACSLHMELYLPTLPRLKAYNSNWKLTPPLLNIHVGLTRAYPNYNWLEIRKYWSHFCLVSARQVWILLVAMQLYILLIFNILSGLSLPKRGQGGSI